MIVFTLWSSQSRNSYDYNLGHCWDNDEMKREGSQSNSTSLVSHVLDLYISEMKNVGFYGRTWQQEYV